MILNISEAANLGIHALTYLAHHYESERPIATIEVAETFNMSSNHLSKVFQRLTKAGLLRSIRGPKGGFRLAQKPNAITLLNIYESIDGVLPPHGLCLLGEATCNFNACVFGGLIEEVHEQVRKYFAGTTLADLVKKAT